MSRFAQVAALLSVAVCLPLLGVPAFGQTPASNHVFIVMEENHSYSQVVGNTADMPYLNSLISQYGLATQYYSNALGSIPDYFMATTGQALDTWSVQNIDNIVRELLPLGKTWKSYAESLPAVGWASGDAYPYTQEHNPFALFSDVVNSSNQINNLVPFSHFATDLANNQLPNYSFIIPNQQNNAHDCPAGLSSCTDSQKLANADKWLQTNIAPLIAGAPFQQDGILVIMFDESNGSDTTHGGGRVEWAVIGPRVKPGYQSTFSYYQNQSTLRLTCDALGIAASSCPAAGATAPAMSEFFSSSTTTTGTISGTVTNSATGAALSGATVSYSGGSTTTNSSGAYTLSNVPAGSVSVTASATGYNSSSATVSVTAGATSTQNFGLTASGGTGGGGSSSAPALVQHAANYAIGATKVSQAFPLTVTAGDLIWAYCRNGTGDALTISDSLSQKWTLVTSTHDGSAGSGSEQVFVWYAANSVGGQDTVTCSDASSANLEIGIVEAKNIATSFPLDQYATGYGSSPSPVTSPVTTTVANEILLTACTWPFTSSMSVGAGVPFTLLDNPLSGGNTGGADEYAIVSATGPYSGTMNIGSSVNWGCILTTFKGSSSTTSTGTISGTVTNAATGAAISGATVSYSGGSTTTNASGAYTLSNVPAGSVSVEASATGFANSTATVSVTAGANTTQNFALTATVVSSSAGHIFIVMEENHNYSSIVGNSAAMPYLNGLIAKYGLATNYYANTHPSIGNYFMLTTGQIISNDDAFTGTVTADNIVRELTAAGRSWKSYAESLPSVGYTGGDVYPYVKHHNPFTYFSDVLNSSSEAGNLVPFSQFATDLANGRLPNYSFIVPNLQNDTHDCPAGMSTCTDTQILANADQWLKNNIDPLINSAIFQQDGILVITWDEADQSNTTNGGGQVAWVVIGPMAKAGYRSTTFYQHASTLRMMCDALGVTTCPGAGATAPTMGEFFSSSTATTGTISGAITNSATGAAISGATVSYSGGSTTTNASGAYTLSSVPAGSVSVTASATGFSNSSTTVSVTAGVTSTQNFALIPVATTGTISGTVTNSATGAAISGATVSYSGGSTTTNTSGAYTLSNVPAGSVSVTASASGFVSSSATVSVTAGVTTTQNFGLTATVIVTTGTISGTVTNAATGAAISGATVSYSGSSTTTNTSGAYTLSNVPAGSVSVTASATGFNISTATISVTAGATATQNFSLTAATTTTGTIAGKVTDINGGNVRGATVVISGPVTVTRTTTRRGNYNSGTIPTGNYTVTVSSTGFTTQSKSATVTANTTTIVNFTLQ